MDFPEQSVYAGDPCPNNPYTKPENQEILDRAGWSMAFVERAVELSSMAKLGMLTGDNITPTEFRVMTSVETYQHIREREAYDKSSTDYEGAGS
jgi:hypothetical protein